MPLVGTAALTEVWAKCKAWFGRGLSSSTTATTASITLTNNGGDTLSTASIPAATTSAAGVMSADDKTKLNGIATGATANTGTVTNVTGTSPITVTNGTTTPNVAHANSGVTAASKGDTANQTPTWGGTFKALSGTVNATGHLTAFADHTVKIPNTAFGTPTSSAAGSVGLVPAPPAGAAVRMLLSDATWDTFKSQMEALFDEFGGGSGFMKFDDSQTDPLFMVDGNLMTDAQVTKLAGIATGAEVNQNAFSNVKVGSTTVAADGKTDTLELVAGSNVTLTPDATNDKVTISTITPKSATISHAICTTAAATAAKVATVDNSDTSFLVAAGAVIAVTFTYGNSAATPTLNVNGTGAKNIAIPSSATAQTTGNGTTYNSWGAYETLLFTYNGSQWVHLGSGYLQQMAYKLAAAAAPKASPALTGTPTAPTPAAGTDTTQIATTAFVQDAMATAKAYADSLMTGAAQFQGTVSAQATISDAAYKKGWYWVVATAGTYVGQACEVGDMIFAIEDKGSAYAAGDFSVVQNNIVEMTVAEVDAICV